MSSVLKSSSSARVPAAMRRRSTPPISACRSRSSIRRSILAASACIAAAFRRRRCCTSPMCSTKRSTPRPGASRSARRRSTSIASARFKTKVVNQLTGGLGQLSKQRKITYIQGTASFRDAHTLEITSEGRFGRISADADLRARDHRDRIAAVDDSRAQHRESAADGLDRRARSARYSEVAAGRRRRLHRPRAGHRLRRARHEGDRRRDDAGTAARRRSRSRQHPREADRVDVRGGAAQHQGRRHEGGEERDRGHLRRRRLPADAPKERTFDRVLVSIGRRPNSAVPGLDEHEGEGQPARLHRSRSGAPDGRAVDLRDRRRRRRADAGAQGLARGACGGRIDCRRARRVRAARDSGRRLHRSRARVVRPDRDRCAEAEPRGHGRAVSRGPRRAAR